MLGYDESTKDGHKLINLATNSVIYSRSVTFIPDVFQLKERHSKFRKDDSDPPDFELTSVTSTTPIFATMRHFLSFHMT